ncbi:MAG: TraR/DksA C4-type zinc finger protein [Arcobacteraceae bacterium]
MLEFYQYERRLKKIDRIYHKTYGESLDCGEDIALGRLKILPTGVLCIACASINR